MLRPASIALASALTLAAPAVALADTTPAAATQVVASDTAPTRAAASTDETNSYAQREQKDQKVADYKGGSFIVVGISGGALVVILILLLILL